MKSNLPPVTAEAADPEERGDKGDYYHIAHGWLTVNSTDAYRISEICHIQFTPMKQPAFSQVQIRGNCFPWRIINFKDPVQAAQLFNALRGGGDFE